jgi:hypothetical protein
MFWVRRLIKTAVTFTGGGYWEECSGGFIEQADPSHVHTGIFNDVMTEGRQQLFLAGGAHDRLIAVAQCGVELTQPSDSGFGHFAVGDVFYHYCELA